jgi:hypothetical protein
MTSTRSRLIFLVSIVWASTAAGTDVRAQATAPAPPKEYRVIIRYRIQAGRTERIRQFFPMVEYFESIGFQKDEGPDNEAEDASLNRMTGRISSANARKLLTERHVKSIMLLPPDFKFPGLEDENTPIKVQLELVPGLPATPQRLLSEQVRERLKEFGFLEAIAYDHRGFTRMVGLIPGGRLDTLVKDIRSEPAGWLVPLRPISDLPSPLRDASPIRVTEVIPEPAGVAPIKDVRAPENPRAQEKITPELRALIANADQAAKPARIEIILSATPSEANSNWPKDLIALVPQLIVEGRYGQIVTAVVAPEKVPPLTESPLVSTIRLPRSGAPLPQPNIDGKKRTGQALDAAGLPRLHALGYKGNGVRAAVIAGDFRGWETLVKNKKLPAATRVLDLTRARNSTIEPEPYPDDGRPLGYGAECAAALALAAPDADLLLIRVDAAAPYQVLAVARQINGERIRYETMDQRHDELDAAHEELQDRFKKLLLERKELFEDFDFEEEGVNKREAHFKKVKEYKAEEQAYVARLGRFLQHQRDLRDLQRLQVVVNTLSWHEGHSVDGSSPLTRYLNNRPFRSTVWFQPAGDTRGQTWTGLFRDADGNGVMEFAAPRTPLPKGRWTSELNFLGWQKFDAKPEPDLPEKAKLRVSIQWREPHEPEFLNRGEDLYREPLANPKLMLLRQRDPTAAKLATDDMELVAYSYGLPQRIDNQPAYATYEQTLEFNVETAGRYALRIEGRIPDDIRPPTALSVPAGRRQFDLRPRVLLEVLDSESRAAGRPVFLDFPTTEGAVGMPGDSQLAVTIGATDRASQPQATTSLGPPMNLELLGKPNFLSADGLEVGAGDLKSVRGTPIAASFAAGLTAASISAGVPPAALLSQRSDPVLRVPDRWPLGRR